MPTVAQTSGHRPASSTTARLVSRSVPIVTMPRTPSARARSSTASRSSAKSGKCRCAWVSKSIKRPSYRLGRDGEAETADELAGGGHDVKVVAALVRRLQVRLLRVGAEAFLAPPAHRGERRDPDEPAIFPPPVADGLLETGRRIHGRIRGQAFPCRHGGRRDWTRHGLQRPAHGAIASHRGPRDAEPRRPATR